MDGFAGPAAATLSRGAPGWLREPAEPDADEPPGPAGPDAHELREPAEPDADEPHTCGVPVAASRTPASESRGRAEPAAGESRGRAAEEQIAEIRLIPRFYVAYAGRQVTLCSRAERVLAFLALEEGISRRSVVAGALWPESTSERALASLRTALWGLSHAEVALVDVTQHALSLRAQVHVDLTEATSLARHAVDGGSDLHEILRAVALLRRDLLIDWAEDWAVIPKEQFRQLRLQALESLADQLISAGRLAQAVVTALDVVGSEPLRESAHLLLMRAYLAQGNRSAAIAQYRSCARLLRDELGLAPSTAMARLLDTALTDPILH